MKITVDLLSKKLWLVIFAAIGLYCCLPLFSPFKMVDVEVFRKPSPDGKYEAVYIQQDAGAMTTANHRIFIVRAGEAISSSGKANFIAKRVFDFDCNWRNDGNLMIRYSKADIQHFNNYVYTDNTQLEKIYIILEMLSGDISGNNRRQTQN